MPTNNDRRKERWGIVGPHAVALRRAAISRTWLTGIRHYDITRGERGIKSPHENGRSCLCDARGRPADGDDDESHATGTWGVIAESHAPGRDRPGHPFPSTACCIALCVSDAPQRDGFACSVGYRRHLRETLLSKKLTRSQAIRFADRKLIYFCFIIWSQNSRNLYLNWRDICSEMWRQLK